MTKKKSTRTCKKCKKTYSREEFPSYKHGKKIFRRTRCLYCFQIYERERQRKYIAQKREAHNERRRTLKRERYNSDPEYREKLKQKSIQYYQENREGILERKRNEYHGTSDSFKPRIMTFRDEFYEGLLGPNLGTIEDDPD